ETIDMRAGTADDTDATPDEDARPSPHEEAGPGPHEEQIDQQEPIEDDEAAAGYAAGGTGRDSGPAGEQARDTAEEPPPGLIPRMIKGMVGRDIDQLYPERHAEIGAEILRIEDWHVGHPTQPGRVVVDGASLYARAGEVVGIAGLMGAGRTELAMSVFGRSYGRDISGRALIHGKEVQLRSVADAIDAGIAYVSEDRKRYGLNLIQDIRTNITAAALKKIRTGG